MSAVHCEELVARAPAADQALVRFGQLGRALAPLVAAQLEPLFAAGKWEPRVGACELTAADMLDAKIGFVAGNFLLPVGDAGGRLFASFALAPIGARLARMFGGDPSGEVTSFGAKLPGSVIMLLRRMERVVFDALSECLDPAVMRAGEEAQFATDFEKLGCFPARTQAAMLTITFKPEEGPPLELLLACRKAMLARLVGHFHAPGEAAVRAAPDRLDPALEAIPVPLRVELSEMTLTARRIMQLAPGQVLPLAVARSVPLKAQGLTVATGSIGEQDDRVALQIERVLLAGAA